MSLLLIARGRRELRESFNFRPYMVKIFEIVGHNAAALSGDVEATVDGSISFVLGLSVRYEWRSYIRNESYPAS